MASHIETSRRRLSVATIAALGTFVAHLIGNPHYGFFRDELYFIICGFHPQWGYVDQPPVVPLLAAGSQVFGHSLFAIRAVVALFAAASVYVSCLIALELGGGVFAQIITALAVFFCPVLMNFGTKMSTDMVGLWLWPLTALLVLRMAKGGDLRQWLLVGAIAGLSLESKYSYIFFAAALLGGLLLTPARRILFSGWLAAGAGICVAIALPNILWQAHYGFPMLELLHNEAHGNNIIQSPVQYLFQEILITNIVLCLVWILGLMTLLRTSTARFLGYAYLILIAAMIFSRGKDYYPANIYPYLFAAGAIALETWTRRATFVRPVVLAVVIVFGLVFLPFSMPVLSEQGMVDYQDRVLGAMRVSKSAVATEHHALPALPPDWADMHGWEELTASVARVYDSLPASERAQTAILASNYGEASALEFFGVRYGLPPVFSGANQYYLWGTRGYDARTLIEVNGDCEAGSKLFAQSRRAATFGSRWGMSYEQNIPIMICRGIREPLAQYWPQKKSYE